MKLKFLIATPKYDEKFGGVMILHQLCDMLNRQGFEAAIVFFGGSAPDFNWATSNYSELFGPNFQHSPLAVEDPVKSIRDFLVDGIVIYPEIIIGNPLRANRIVKYLLYKDENYSRSSDNEYILSFSKIFHSNPDSYLFKPFSDKGLHANGALHWSQRTMDLTYFGKGPKFTECFTIPDTLVLSRTWPEDKHQLGILLRQCRYFFTWDSVSQTNTDAVTCGAVPVLLNDAQINKMDLDRGELGALPDISISDLKNKFSVVGNADIISNQMNEMCSKVNYYEKSWPERVNNFANDVLRFFSSNI
jgi:hypothetical protein